MQRDWFMQYLRSNNKNRLEFPFKRVLDSTIVKLVVLLSSIYPSKCCLTRSIRDSETSIDSVQVPPGSRRERVKRASNGAAIVTRLDTISDPFYTALAYVKLLSNCELPLSYRRLPARRDLFWEDYARSSFRKKVTCIEMIITPKNNGLFLAIFILHSWQIFKFFIWKR